MSYRDGFFDNNESNHGWYTCVRCGKKLRKDNAEIDHIIPQSRGGSDNKNNLQCMCVHCNRSKGNSMDDSLKDYSRNVVNNTKKDISKAVGGLFKKR